jgi:hypothetical protein
MARSPIRNEDEIIERRKREACRQHRNLRRRRSMLENKGEFFQPTFTPFCEVKRGFVGR